MWRVMERMATGEAEMREIDLLLDVASQVEGHTICGLGDAAAWPIQGLFRHFRHEVEDRITSYRARPAARAGRDPGRGGHAAARRATACTSPQDVPPPAAPAATAAVATERRVHAQGQGQRRRGRVRERHDRAAGGRAGRRGDSALLLPRAALDRRQLPHVPGRGEAGAAEAAGLLRAAGRRRPGDLHQHADGEEGARRG